MDFLESNNHAYILVGDRSESVRATLDSVANECGLAENTNPDLFVSEKNTITIDDVHTIRSWQKSKPERHTRKFALVSGFSFTREAQNALLKTLEEPSGDTVIILCVETESILLPTIRSRAQIVVRQKTAPKIPDYIYEILSLPAGERLNHKTVTNLFAKKNTEDKIDREALIAFLYHLEYRYAESIALTQKIDTASERGFEALFQAKKYARDTSSSLKMLIEHVLLMVPQIKV